MFKDRRVIIHALIAVFLAIILITVNIVKDNVIIYSGIKQYSMIINVLASLLTLNGLCLVEHVVVSQLKNADAFKKSRKAEKKPVLKAGDMLEPDAVREQIQRERARWLPRLKDKNLQNAKRMDASFRTISFFLDEMDERQERLHNLLETNGADALCDTEDMLVDIEQCVCNDIRKFINTISVLSPWNDDDYQLVFESADECIAEARARLEQTRGLVMAITQFINKQGDDKDNMAEIERYRKTIMGYIQKEDTDTDTEGEGLTFPN